MKILLNTLLCVTLFLSLLYPYYDHDWGWHFKNGEYFIKHHEILRQDIFSWSMPGYEFVNHSWTYDIVLYFLYSWFGFPGLIFSSAAITLAIFIIATAKLGLKFWQKVALAVFFVVLGRITFEESLRGQIVALLFLVIEARILSVLESKPKSILVMIPLFFLWANFHGTFLMGLAVLFLFFVWHSFIKKTTDWIGLISFTTALLVSFINPFTFKAHLEVLMTFGSPILQKVGEWLPLRNTFNPFEMFVVFVYFSLFVFLFIRQKKPLLLPAFLLGIFLFVQALRMQRYLAIFGVVTLPFFAQFFANDSLIKKIGEMKVVNPLVCLLLVVALEYNLFVRLPKDHFFSYNFSDFCDHIVGQCSPKLLTSFKKNPPPPKTFNFYNWGGLLIGTDTMKVFVDGRMHLWERNGYSAFSDFDAIYQNGDYQKFSDYDFDAAIIVSYSYLAKEIKSGRLGKWRIDFEDDRMIYFVKVRS